MRRLVCSALIFLAASCATRQPMTGQAAPDVDRKLSTFAYIEEGKLVTFIVDTRATGFRGENKYIPVEIAISNNGVKQLTLTRESFILVDDKGNRYPCASPKEVLDNYDLVDLDTGLRELDGIVFNRFGAQKRYRCKFFSSPSAGRGVITERVQVPKFGYVLDMIYFPMPAGGLKDRTFELVMTAPELTDAIFVKFEVK